METINIGGLPFPASRIGLGTWSIGGWMWSGSDARAAIRTIQVAVD
jgi:aryl-alcohol dehydrogenase-like predicted oxidoreductase